MTTQNIAQDDSLTSQSAVYTLRKRWKLLVAIQVIVVLCGFYIYYITPKVYQISSSIGLDRPYTASNWQSYTVEKENQTIVRILTSEELLEQAIATLSLPIEAMKEVKVIAKIPKDSNIVNVDLEDYVPSRMPLIFHTMITLAEVKASENISSGWNNKVDYLRNQIKSAEEKLAEVDKQLQVFIQQEGVLGVADKLREISQEAQGLKQEQRQNEVELGIIDEALIELRKKAKEMSRSYRSSSHDFSELNDLQRELIQLKREQVKLASLYQQDHPEMRTNADQIAMIQKMYEKKLKEVQPGQDQGDSRGSKDAYIFQRILELETQQKSLTQKIRLATTLGDEKTQAFKAMANKLEEYSSLTRKQKINEAMHSQLLAKLNETELEKDVKNVTFKVLSKPVIPAFPIRPRFLSTILWALALGTIFGFIVILTQETIASTFQNPEEAQEAIGLTCLGIIPDFKHLFAKPYDKKVEMCPALITYHHRNSPESESFRSLRAAIQHLAKAKPFRSLMLTAWGGDMGKSTLTANLAMVYAQTGLKVLLVDGDLRKPVLHSFFFQSNQRGLTDYVLGEPLDNVILPTGQMNLWLLPTGPLPPDPSDFLGSAAMETRFKEMVEQFDLVFFDAPPIGLVSDVMNFAQRIDAILYLAPLGREKKTLTLKGVELLKLVAAPVIGMVCNFVNYYEPTNYKYGYKKYNS